MCFSGIPVAMHICTHNNMIASLHSCWYSKIFTSVYQVAIFVPTDQAAFKPPEPNTSLTSTVDKYTAKRCQTEREENWNSQLTPLCSCVHFSPISVTMFPVSNFWGRSQWPGQAALGLHDNSTDNTHWSQVFCLADFPFACFWLQPMCWSMKDQTESLKPRRQHLTGFGDSEKS